MKNFALFREQAAAKAFLTLSEKEMTPAQMKKREEIAQSMDDADFKKRYGKDWMSVKMATATKQAMKEDYEEKIEENEDKENQHYCAKHIYHHVFGEGVVVEGEHAEPDEEGRVEWYTVEFPHGKEMVKTEEVEVMMAEYHMNHSRKKKKMNEMSSKEKMKKGLYNKEEVEEVEEELVGNQHKIDMNKNNKIDAQDFKMLRKSKQTRK